MWLMCHHYQYIISTNCKYLKEKYLDHFFLFYFTALRKLYLKSLLVFWIVLRPSFRTSFVYFVKVCSLRFIFGYEGWGILYPTNSTSEWPESTVLNIFPKVWSSLLKTYVAQRLSFYSWWMISPYSFCPSSFISSTILDSYDTISSSSDKICSESDISDNNM